MRCHFATTVINLSVDHHGGHRIHCRSSQQGNLSLVSFPKSPIAATATDTSLVRPHTSKPIDVIVVVHPNRPTMPEAFPTKVSEKQWTRAASSGSLQRTRAGCGGGGICVHRAFLRIPTSTLHRFDFDHTIGTSQCCRTFRCLVVHTRITVSNDVNLSACISFFSPAAAAGLL